APDDGSVRVAPIAEGGGYTTVLDGGDYTSLSWDGYGNLWVLEDLSDEVARARQEEDLADDTEPGDTASEGSGRSGAAPDGGRRRRPGRGARAGAGRDPGRPAAGLPGRHPGGGPDRGRRGGPGPGGPGGVRRVVGVPAGLPAPGRGPGHRHRPVLERRRPVGG